MPANTKRVFYVNRLTHRVFADVLGTRPDISLDKLENDLPQAEIDATLGRAHAYQIGAARDEIPPTCTAPPT